MSTVSNKNGDSNYNKNNKNNNNINNNNNNINNINNKSNQDGISSPTVAEEKKKPSTITDSTTAVAAASLTSRAHIFQHMRDWGSSPLPPTILATFITALHFRPFQPFPMLFPPVLLFTSYLNLQDLTRESASLSATFSGLYFLMAKRRKEKVKTISGLSVARLRSRFFSARGLTRGAAMGVAAINCLCGGLTYFGFGNELVLAT